MKVKIKTWAAMKKEFGMVGGHSIKATSYFHLNMNTALPKNRIINLLKWRDSEFHDGHKVGNWKPYVISDDMIEIYNVDDWSFSDLTPIMSDVELKYELNMLHHELNIAAALLNKDTHIISRITKWE